MGGRSLKEAKPSADINEAPGSLHILIITLLKIFSNEHDQRTFFIMLFRIAAFGYGAILRSSKAHVNEGNFQQ